MIGVTDGVTLVQGKTTQQQGTNIITADVTTAYTNLCF